MKILIRFITLGLLIGSGFVHAAAEKPNVIFIKTDDQRRDSLSMTGHPVTKTPNIDRLAKEGVFFGNAFITSPICGPSRANFFTGQWERKNRQGFTYVSKNHIPKELFDNSWLMQLKQVGYFTGYIGKHHAQIGPQREQNRYMKENIDFCYMKPGHLGFDLMKWKEFKNLKNSSQIEGLFEATEVFMRSEDDKDYFFDNADASVKDFLHRRDTSKPFCLSINFNLPHAASIGGMGKKESDPEMYKSLYNNVQDEFVFPKGYPNIKVPLPENVFRQDELMGYYRTTNQKALLDKKTKMARAVYTQKNAQFHWGVSPALRWALFDTQSDPSCQQDLTTEKPELASTLTDAYDRWWEKVYPVMMKAGGDAASARRRVRR